MITAVIGFLMVLIMALADEPLPAEAYINGVVILWGTTVTDLTIAIRDRRGART